MNPLPGAFLGLCSDFLVFIVISQNHRLTKIRSTNTNGEFMAPAPTYKMEFLVMIVNNIVKSLILDVPGVSGYIIVIIYFWLQLLVTDVLHW